MLRLAILGLLLVAGTARAAERDFIFARYQLVDESNSVLWGKCPANLAVRKPFVLSSATPVVCPAGYDEFYRGILYASGPTAADVHCWADADQVAAEPPGLVQVGKCTVCWGPQRDKPCLQVQGTTRQALGECGDMMFRQPRFLSAKPLETPGSVVLTGAAVVQYGTTECPTRQPIDPAQNLIPAAYQTQAYTKLYAGKVYRGAGNALAQQCWEAPPGGPAGTWTAVGDCVVCQ